MCAQHPSWSQSSSSFYSLHATPPAAADGEPARLKGDEPVDGHLLSFIFYPEAGTVRAEPSQVVNHNMR